MINGQYVYVHLDENESDSTKVVGMVIEDETSIESIKDDGKQVFAKEKGVTIDKEYIADN